MMEKKGQQSKSAKIKDWQTRKSAPISSLHTYIFRAIQNDENQARVGAAGDAAVAACRLLLPRAALHSTLLSMMIAPFNGFSDCRPPVFSLL